MPCNRLIATYIYNFYSSSLRAIGDSRTPLYFLIISCILNAILCVIFITVFKFGVAGSAIATVIAQGISSILCVAYVYTKIPMLSLKREDLVVDKELLKLSLQYSWVTALQQTCLYIGKLLVQGVVNPFGTNAIAAYNSVTRVDTLVIAAGDSFSSSVATFSAQNKGAGKMNRITEGFKKSYKIMAIYSGIVTLVVFTRPESIMKLFVSADEKEVIMIGIEYLKTISIFYLLSNTNYIFQGLFRGLGELRITFLATLIQMGIRVALSYILAPLFGIASVCYAVAAGWVVMQIYEIINYKKCFRQENQIEESIG